MSEQLRDSTAITQWANGRPSEATGPPRPCLYAGPVFFIFGYGIKRQSLGPGQTRTCPRCHNTTQWSRIRQFKQFTLFFVPIARWKRQEFEECGICGTVSEI